MDSRTLKYGFTKHTFLFQASQQLEQVLPLQRQKKVYGFDVGWPRIAWASAMGLQTRLLHLLQLVEPMLLNLQKFSLEPHNEEMEPIHGHFQERYSNLFLYDHQISLDECQYESQ